MPEKAQMLTPLKNCAPIHQKGAVNEPISEVITCFMALPVQRDLASQISLSGADRQNWF